MDLYTWYQWMAFFYCYSFLGWIFESLYVSARTRHLVNRGFLRLPLLPLYGSGALMMLLVSRPFQNSLLLTWLSGFAGATVLEYVVGWAMEQLFKIRYWDYSSQKFNLHGYICLSSSIAWGFLTIFMTHVIHRPIAKFICEMPVLPELCLVLAVTVIFLLDTFVCMRAALDLGRTLEAANRIRQELEDIRVQTALMKMDAGDRISEKRAELENWLEEREAALSVLRKRRAEFLQYALRANPSMASRKYAEELKEMIKNLDENRKNKAADRKQGGVQ